MDQFPLCWWYFFCVVSSWVSTGWSQFLLVTWIFIPTDSWGLGFGLASRQEAVGVPYLKEQSHFCQGKGVMSEYTTRCCLSGGERESSFHLWNDGGALVLCMTALVSGATWASHGICHWSWHLFDRKLLPAWVSSLLVHLLEETCEILKNLLSGPCTWNEL